MKKDLQRKKDILCAGVMAVTLLFLVYVLLAFFKNGLDAPYAYTGGDDFLAALTFKTLRNNPWIWFNNDLGAPFGQAAIANPSALTCNFDLCIEKLLSLLFDDPFEAVNAFFLLIIPMCSVSAFFALRELGVNRAFSVFGSVLFSLSPYIFNRSVVHLSLTTCYFVPLSILLCVWTAQGGEDYLAFRTGFFRKKKNIATIIFCLLIANSGMGYYPVFTCYFLLIVACFKLGRQRKLSAIKQPCIVIALIAAFFILSILPHEIYILRSGEPIAVVRSLADGELYGLKIAQLFIPLNGHGIGLIEKVINAYNSNMPLVNENASAYLGVGGIVGFLISMLVSLFGGQAKEGEVDPKLTLFSHMNIWAILFATIGGFSSLVALAGFHFLRGANRISIFISFISICVLCISLQKLYERLKEKSPRGLKMLLYWLGVVVLVCVSVYDVLPTYGANDGRLAANAEASRSDHEFIQSIDAQMDEGDMIYQLPYHKYPEAGFQNDMTDYDLLVGYLHSDKLKWSYGVMKGSDGDQWQELVAELPMEDRIEVVISAGYKGLYIDARAYTAEGLERLRGQIGEILEAEPSVSENGNFLFYDLRPYILSHPELLEAQMPTIEELSARRAFTADDLAYLGETETMESGEEVILHPNATQFGPYIDLEEGQYQVTITGDNLDEADYDATSSNGASQIERTGCEQQTNRIVYEFTLEDHAEGIEFRLFNHSAEDMRLDSVEVVKVG